MLYLVIVCIGIASSFFIVFIHQVHLRVVAYFDVLSPRKYAIAIYTIEEALSFVAAVVSTQRLVQLYPHLHASISNPRWKMNVSNVFLYPESTVLDASCLADEAHYPTAPSWLNLSVEGSYSSSRCENLFQRCTSQRLPTVIPSTDSAPGGGPVAAAAAAATK